MENKDVKITTKRGSFSGKAGFVLAAAGSAVGLGNIWRFPYLAAKYGGGIFLLVYTLLSVTFGFSLMVAEIALGRKTGKSAPDAFRAFDRRFAFCGVISVGAPMIILPYYSVIGGWVIKYFLDFLFGKSASLSAGGFFDSYTASVWQPLLWFFVFIGATALIVLLGVEKGIEKVSRVLMPVLILLTAFISIYSIVAIDGAWDGVLYYLTPRLSDFSVMTVVAAVGQIFYSMSIAMGVLITFGSYMKKDISIEKSAKQIEIFDLAVALLSGLMIVPAVYAFSGGDKAALSEGSGLMFVTLPKLFSDIPGGAVIGTVFFFLVLLAALTSAIALMEAVVSVFIDKLKLTRPQSCLLVFLISIVLGVLSSLGYGKLESFRPLGMTILDFFDFLSNSVIMPTVALISCIFIGWVIKPKTLVHEIALTGRFKSEKTFSLIIRYVAPVFIGIILLSAIFGALGLVSL